MKSWFLGLSRNAGAVSHSLTLPPFVDKPSDKPQRHVLIAGGTSGQRVSTAVALDTIGGNDAESHPLATPDGLEGLLGNKLAVAVVIGDRFIPTGKERPSTKSVVKRLKDLPYHFPLIGVPSGPDNRQWMEENGFAHVIELYDIVMTVNVHLEGRCTSCQ